MFLALRLIPMSLRMKTPMGRRVQMPPLPHLARLAPSLNLKVNLFAVLIFINLSISFYIDHVLVL